MGKLIGCLIGAFCFLALPANAQQKKHTLNYEKEGYVKATIIKYDVDGCGFLIELNDKVKTKLAANNLTDEFKKNNEKVWVKYILNKKQLPSTCMAGKQAELSDIKKRK